MKTVTNTKSVAPSRQAINKKSVKGKIKDDELKNRLAELVLRILADKKESPGNRTYAGMLGIAIKDNNARSAKIQLARITTVGAADLLNELEEVPVNKQ